MYYRFISYTILVAFASTILALSGCKDSTNELKSETKSIIQLHNLTDTHPNKNQMEWFLNNYHEKFSYRKNSENTLNDQDLILAKYNFHAEESGTTVILIFCENQKNALEVGTNNFTSKPDNHHYGVNGAVLFVVSGTDQYSVNEILSWFAGEE